MIMAGRAMAGLGLPGIPAGPILAGIPAMFGNGLPGTSRLAETKYGLLSFFHDDSQSVVDELSSRGHQRFVGRNSPARDDSR